MHLQIESFNVIMSHFVIKNNVIKFLNFIIVFHFGWLIYFCYNKIMNFFLNHFNLKIYIAAPKRPPCMICPDVALWFYLLYRLVKRIFPNFCVKRAYYIH